jgi:hypothetical protein
VLAAIALAGLALSAWEGTIVQSSSTAHWSVLALIAVTLGAAVAGGRGRQRTRSGPWLQGGARTAFDDVTGRARRPAVEVAGTVVWALLIAATIGWDLYSFTHQHAYLPTFSRVVGAVTRHDWGRALVFSAWLSLGAYLALGWRRPHLPAPEDEATR